MQKIKQVLKEIFITNLGVGKGEKILVFTDKFLTPTVGATLEAAQNIGQAQDLPLRLIAETAYVIGREFTDNMEYCIYNQSGTHGAEPPYELWVKAFGKTIIDKLKAEGLFDKISEKKADNQDISQAEKIISADYKDAVDAVIALSYYSTSHTRFRDFLTRICGTRYASMPMFDEKMLDGAMRVDWTALERKSNIIADAVNKAVTLKINTPNGTDMVIVKNERTAHADTGNLRAKGSFGNLPAGEAYFAPIENLSYGVMVLDWTPTRKLLTPIKLLVKKGNVVDVQGYEEYADVLRKKLSERAEFSNIAELGIGTNNMAIHPENILEAEKIAGTIHIALGDNSSFGGVIKTPFHQDFIFFQPTVILVDGDGRETALIKDGEFHIDLLS
jgi:leucyl aminopeptidase (aminopeptidase T)